MASHVTRDAGDFKGRSAVGIDSRDHRVRASTTRCGAPSSTVADGVGTMVSGIVAVGSTLLPSPLPLLTCGGRSSTVPNVGGVVPTPTRQRQHLRRARQERRLGGDFNLRSQGQAAVAVRRAGVLHRGAV